MTTKVLELYEKTRSFSDDELEELLGLIIDDPRLREDIFDIALIRETEKEGGGSVTLDEFRAGKRTYNAR